jgi:RND family efflux transporter MFP subunit
MHPMRYTEPDQPGPQLDIPKSNEERLRQENQDLKRQLQELKGSREDVSDSGVPMKMWRPSNLTITVILLVIGVLVLLAFFAGFAPRQKRMAQINGEAQEREQALPRVEVIQVIRSGLKSGLQLPGSIQAIAEAPVLARADGYLARRLVDIGDRIKAGQPLAEIEAPELDAQVRQAKANVQQAQASLEQAVANLEQGKSDMELARVTAERWTQLATQGIASQQENDQYQAQYRSRLSSVQALEKGILVQRSSIAVAEANVSRLERMQSYRLVKAPFDGVITLRNVDVGALVNAGDTLLFRMAQTGTVRVYVSVPQSHSASVKPGQQALLTVSNLPGREFVGTVTRSSNALDPTSRTLLVEVNVPNQDNALLPGMYAQVNLSTSRTAPPLVIPSDALIVRADGAQVAVIRPDHSVHLQKIEVARDYGDRLEVAGGLEEGDMIIANPGDVAREGLKVDPVPRARNLMDESPAAVVRK